MKIKIIEKKAFQTCNNCKNEQEIFLNKSILLDNILQDVTGKYLICSKCKSLTPTEYDENYFFYHS